MRLPLALVLLTVIAGTTACAGVYLPPSVNVPALRRAGQATVSANARIFSPQVGAHALAAVAVTDELRIAGSINGAFDRDRRRGIYGEALAGAEPMLTRGTQLGVLVGMGYGDVSAKHSSCHGHDMCFSGVPASAAEQVRAHYVRYALQAHLTFHARKVVHGGGGLRLSLMDMRVTEVEQVDVHARGRPIAVEPFAFLRLGWPFLQFEWQLRYTGVARSPRVNGESVVVADQLTYVFGLRVLFGRGITRHWTVDARPDGPQEHQPVSADTIDRTTEPLGPMSAATRRPSATVG